MKKKISLEETRYSIKTLGFCKLEGVLKNELILSLKAELDLAIEQDRQEIENYDSYHFNDIVHQLIGRGESFLDVLANPTLNLIVNEILSPTAIIHSYNGVKLMPYQGNNASKLHRDCPRFYNQDYPLMLQALVCLDEFKTENGGTMLLPGSHHLEEAPSSDYFETKAVRITAEPGDIVMFDSLMWHCGGKNLTKLPRRGITIVYSRSFMKQQIDLCRAIPSSLINSMDKVVRQRIGMDVRVPASFSEFSLPQEKRLYKANQG